MNLQELKMAQGPLLAVWLGGQEDLMGSSRSSGDRIVC